MNCKYVFGWKSRLALSSHVLLLSRNLVSPCMFVQVELAVEDLVSYIQVPRQFAIREITEVLH